MATIYAAIDASNAPGEQPRTVYAIGEEEVAVSRAVKSPAAIRIVKCSPAAARLVEREGGRSSSPLLWISGITGVCLLSEVA